MRVLFTTCSEKSYLHSMVPLAWALRTAGHDVRIASQPELTDAVTRAGLTAVTVGRNPGSWRMAQLDPAAREAQRPGLPAPYDSAVLGPAGTRWERMYAGYDYVVKFWHKMDNFPMIVGMVDFARHWRPDLVIWEPTTFAGSVAARACGAAHARLLWSIDVFGVARDHLRRLTAGRPPADRADPLADWLERYARRYDFEFAEDLITGQFTIDQLPASLRMEADLHYVPMRYTPYGGPAVIPKWLWAPPERPRVALTLGIAATDRLAGYVANVADILDALADLDIELVATIAESAQRKLTRVPDNTRVVPYAPLQALAATCAVVINHAGPGTFLTTALHPVPQLTLPWDFDEPELARRAAAHGAALTIPADRATGRAVRDAVLRLLHEPAFRHRAADLRDEMHALPTPNQLVPSLEELTTKHRTTIR